jgi:hypothetical protein
MYSPIQHNHANKAILDSYTQSGVDISDAVLKKHTQDTDLYLGTQLSRIVWVDKFRTDLYTETGNITKPFKTIQAAVDYIASIAVLGQDWNILINSGQYVENVTLQSTGLYSIGLTGHGVVGIAPAAGNSLQSTSNNGNLVKFRMTNIEFTKPVVFTGPNAGTCFADVWIENCIFNDALTLTCLNNFSISNGLIVGAVTLNNIVWFLSQGQQIQSTFSMTCDSTVNAPSGGSNGTSMILGNYNMGAVTLTKGGTATGVLCVVGSRINSSSGTITIPAGWTAQAYGSSIRGNLTNNGTLNLRSGFVEKTLTNNATMTLDQPASQVKNDSSLTGTTVKDALNTLSGGVASSSFTTADIPAKTVTITNGIVTSIV